MAHIKRRNIAFTVAYLIGVSKQFLDNDYNGCDELFESIDNNDNANIIRYLCKLRTSLMKNFKRTDDEIRYCLKNLNSIEWFDKSEIAKLEKLGVNVVKANYRAESYSVLFCKLIDDYIDNCKDLFPDWLSWDYVRSLFVVPNYTSKSVLISEFEKFKGNVALYPYSMYIYWTPFECRGMLLNDQVFLESLYLLHGTKFTDRSKYIEASSVTTDTIYDFIDSSNKVVIAVDCENADVYKLYGFLNTLSTEVSSKVEKIILFDDENTVETWKLLSKYTKIPVEYTIVERVLERKSLVDIKMTAGICHSHYRDNVDSFILVSSDSDYCGVISSLPDARFMVVYENIKSSGVARKALSEKNVICCSLDDFYTGDTTKLKEGILIQKVNSELSSYNFNCKDLLNNVYKDIHMIADDEEKGIFYEKYMSKLKLHLDKEGNVSLIIGSFNR